MKKTVSLIKEKLTNCYEEAGINVFF